MKPCAQLEGDEQKAPLFAEKQTSSATQTTGTSSRNFIQPKAHAGEKMPSSDFYTPL